ncbi:MAG: hypothetical protein ORN29_10590, partial [Rhodoferax sp.]|nr:hypothetical protein [Rhodoferax sp.]
MLPFNSHGVEAGFGVQWPRCLLVWAVLLCSACGGGSGSTPESDATAGGSVATQNGTGIDSIDFGTPQQSGLLPVTITVP